LHCELKQLKTLECWQLTCPLASLVSTVGIPLTRVHISKINTHYTTRFPAGNSCQQCILAMKHEHLHIENDSGSKTPVEQLRVPEYRSRKQHELFVLFSPTAQQKSFHAPNLCPNKHWRPRSRQSLRSTSCLNFSRVLVLRHIDNG